METTIIVHLEDCPSSMGAEIRQKAENRFAKELRKNFASDDAMGRAYKLFTDASEGGMISKSDEQIAIQWRNAFTKAAQAGFRDIAVEEAYFNVRLQA